MSVEGIGGYAWSCNWYEMAYEYLSGPHNNNRIASGYDREISARIFWISDFISSFIYDMDAFILWLKFFAGNQLLQGLNKNTITPRAVSDNTSC